LDELIAKAEILLEALPYMKRFRGRTVVVKYGGAAMTNAELESGFAEDVVLLQSLGLKLVIVHGGGPQIGKTLERLGIETRFVRGLRVTDEATMQVVEMVLAGQINKNIVALIQRHGGKAAGLCGKDGNTLLASKMLGDGGVDLGQVGQIDTVNPELVRNLLDDGFLPVVAPIATDAAGGSYNINADIAAARIAQALGAEKLILLTDVAGILDQAGKLQPFLAVEAAKAQIKKGSISEGMVPKVECAMDALLGGVRQVHIIDGRVSHAVLLEIFTRGGVGTEVVLEEPPAPAARKGAGASAARGKKTASA
jgi:acetylglutamate kinase